MLNKVMLIGRVGKNPEIKRFESGNMVASFSLATSRKVKEKKVTQWHNCKAWNKLAEIIEKYVVKGMLIYVDGEIQYDTKDDKTYTTVNVGTMQMLGSKNEESAKVHTQNAPPDEDDSLPF